MSLEAIANESPTVGAGCSRIVAEWVAVAQELDAAAPALDVTQLAALARTELTAVWRCEFAARACFAWAEPRRLAERKFQGPAIATTDVPQVLADVHQLLLSYKLRRLANGSFAARRCTNRRRRDGIYFTPPAVAHYMVRRLFEPLLAESTPTAQASQPITLLDPACGAGGFLLAALQQFAEWYVEQGKALPLAAITERHLFGVDLDPDAVVAAEFNLTWACSRQQPTAALPDLSSNLIRGNALTGRDFQSAREQAPDDSTPGVVDWPSRFKSVLDRGGFTAIVANPPYRRELDQARELAPLAESPLGEYRTPRMNLWYYFAHRAVRLLHREGRMGFLTNSYWLQAASANKLRQALHEEVALEELLLLGTLPLFPRVTGQHLIFFADRQAGDAVRVMRLPESATDVEAIFANPSQHASQQQVDRAKLLGIASRGRLSSCHGSATDEPFVPLEALGRVRQGIAENPATINARTNARFDNRWQVGEGVFSLSADEVAALGLSEDERQLLRPYTRLAELGRYRFDAPTRALIYSTRHTWPRLEQFPRLAAHLARFREIMSARRETAQGKVAWWQLHWPRDEQLWHGAKLLCPQFGERPSCVAVDEPSYVPFSVNVFAPEAATGEHLNYLSAIINSSVMLPWFAARAKRRGVGWELNGHVLRQVPIRRINFDAPKERVSHDRLVELVREQVCHPSKPTAQEIESIVASLYERLNLA